MKKISLIGLGAIGSAYGSYIHKSDSNLLQVIVDKERFDSYRNSYRIINGEEYKFNFILPETKISPSDLIIIAVKDQHLNQAIIDIRNQVGPNTIILSLLNGISSEETIGEVYGMEKLLYSYSVGIDALRHGNEVNFTNIGRIVFGEEKNKILTPKVQAVKELFDRSKIPYEIPSDMIRSLWWKFMINVGINQTSAVLKAPYGIFQNVKEAKDLMETVMMEVIALANHLNIDLNINDVNNFHPVLNTLSPSGKTSMLQDIEAHRKTEVEIFAGKIIELGKKHSIPTPANEMMFRIIRTLENMYD